MTINDYLLSQAENGAERADMLKCTAATYLELKKELPSLFAVPNEIIVKNGSEFDAVFIYHARPDESTEALRLALSMSFGLPLPMWQCELEKETGVLSIFSIYEFNGRRVLLKIVGANQSDYELKMLHDMGSRVLGKIAYARFVPLDVVRSDMSVDFCMGRVIMADSESYYHRRLARVLSLVGNHISPTIPIPKDFSLGLDALYDLDLIYDSDTKFDMAGWTLSVQKSNLERAMRAIMDVACGHLSVRVRMSILQPPIPERLSLVYEAEDFLVYSLTPPESVV